METRRNLTLHTDLYEINMIETYWRQHVATRKAVFELYFRKLPFKNGYAIFAGLARIIEYLEQLKFTNDDLDYLKKIGYQADFLNYLAQYHFSATVRSVPEGAVVFANEPLIQVEGNIVDAQLVETAFLNFVNYQTLIATKAARIKNVAGDDLLLEFGSRRAQETDAAFWGARAAYISGFDATSNVKAGEKFGIPVSGTHAHSLVQAFGSDYAAFKAYALTHRDSVFLVDTFDTLQSGVPAAIKVAKEFKNQTNFLGVRIDSGDMAALSKQVRYQLDQAGFEDAKIYASNDLDERTILNLKMQDAKIDVWGVGTKLITGFDQPALGGVYKLVAMEDAHGHMRGTLKLSNNVAKISTPGKKQIWRITRKDDTKFKGDYIATAEENLRTAGQIELFDPEHPYMNQTIRDFKAKPLLQEIFKHGKLIYSQPKIAEIRRYTATALERLWPEYKRQLNPQEYPVHLSRKLYQQKIALIQQIHQTL
ncbi:nicotinate phosphoribosyltransferase [Lactiplantibacillus modestisalitolerans]|uniref:Nicotinate phosphoribosyltransferase n=1 Tax=Lactiplantibacillus modestisalitolerans TaxID=1457219 RepID=A0ABV5WWK2_9LACO|nr:nicotinate phosphoribosyltransferase [Lactiplantibacillus modestisalitolerans]